MLGRERVAERTANKAFNSRKKNECCGAHRASSSHYSSTNTVCLNVDGAAWCGSASVTTGEEQLITTPVDEVRDTETQISFIYIQYIHIYSL